MIVLVTGGAGFIGSHLAAHHVRKGDTVRVLDDLSTGRESNLQGVDAELIPGSILDPRQVRSAAARADLVYHLAAQVSVPASVADVYGTVALNVVGLLHVLEAAAAGGARKVVHFSSAAVYGDAPPRPTPETALPAPLSPYAWTKLAGEHACAEATAAGRVETVVLRCFNVYGPRQDPASPYAAVIPAFFAAARAGRPLRLHGDGGQTRDFIHVDDVVAAAVHLAGSPGRTGVYNAGSGQEVSVAELARTVLAVTGSESRLESGPGRAGDVRHSCACVDRLLATGWRPAVTLAAGLAGLAARPA